MALNVDKNLKKYYSIKEVAARFGVSESLLRYWEKEFPHLRPKTSSTNNIRQYSEKDIEQINVIYTLVKKRGVKLSAARKYLNENRAGADRSADVLSTLSQVSDELRAIKKQLDALT